MNQTERFYIIDNLLQTRRYTTRDKFLEALEGCSISQFKRDLSYMRDHLYAPIEYNSDVPGYYLDTTHPDIRRYHLPGLWFNSEEIFAILTLQHYFENVSPELLGSHLSPLRERMRDLLRDSRFKEKDLAKKLRIVHLGRRRINKGQFEKVAHALMAGTRLNIRYYSRPRDEYSDREISPLRMLHYRENWYLDAWCHTSKAFRTFAVDAIEASSLNVKRAKRFSSRAHDKYVSAGYGIFSGEDIRWATLRFTKERTRWVKAEEWHQDQDKHLDEEDRYVLRVPYTRDEELLMDILKYGPDVEVVEPVELRQKVKSRLEAAIRYY